MLTLPLIGLLLICGTLAAQAQDPLQQLPAQQPPVQIAPPVVPQQGVVGGIQIAPQQAAQQQGVVGGIRVIPQQANQQLIQLQLMPNGYQNPGGGGLTFPQDRTTLRNLRLAQQMVDEKNYTEAVAVLGNILTREEDFFFQPDGENVTHTSIKAEIRRMIGALPAEGREAYELRFGVEAKNLLQTAIANQDIGSLTKVAGSYFHTSAGYDATYLLGLRHLDHGQPLAAALALRQLQGVHKTSRDRYEPALSLQTAMAWSQAGMQQEALATLTQLREDRPNAVVNLGGQRITLPADDNQLVAWLANVSPVPTGVLTATDQWSMFRGDAARNAQASGGMPILNKQWEARGADNVAQVETLLSQMLKQNSQLEEPLLPSLHPICVNGTYIFRSPVELVAVDARTGKRLWNGAQDNSMNKLLASSGTLTRDSQNPENPSDVLKQTLLQRAWSDLTFGTISSDGRNVYCVGDLPVSGNNLNAVTQRGNVWIVNPGGPAQAPVSSASNRLRAYGLSNQGKLMREWPVGYEDDPLEGAFFLGPPLPLGDTLYVLAELGGAENNGSLALVALDPQAPPEDSVLWVQTLGVVEQSIMYSHLRRSGGFSPSFAEGVLVCPTGNGAVIGFDLISRSLLWGYSYQSLPPNSRFYPLVGWQQNLGDNANGVAQGGFWADNSITIVGGKVICAPQDSDRLHCIDLLTGKSAWENNVQREDSRYVAGVVDDSVLLVGTRGVRAVGLDSGQVLWQHQLPDQRYPAGRGFFHGGQYHLPLASRDLGGEISGEIAIVDMPSKTLRVPDDQIERPARVALGNLICYEGAVFSQNAVGAQRYDRYEDLMDRIAGRLREGPRDVAALLQHANLLRHDGRFEEALAQFRLAHEIAATEETRSALLSALLDGLTADFATYRSDLALIQQLVKSPEDRARFSRTLGDQLEIAGERVAAFEAYLELSEIDARKVPLHSLSMEWLVRPDRWLQRRMAEIQAGANAAEKAEIDAALQQRLSYHEGETADDLRRLLDYFGNLPAAESVRRRLITQLMAQSDPPFIEIESHLHTLQDSQDPEIALAAFVDLADLYSRLNLRYAATPYLNKLAADYADTVVRGEMTGKQLVEEFGKYGKDFYGMRLAPEYNYPQGRATITEGNLVTVPRSYGVPEVEAMDSTMGPMRFETEDEQKLRAVNEYGRLIWETQISQNNVLLRMAQGGQRVGLKHHVAVLWTGNHLIGIDALGDEDSGSGRDPLWVQPLVEQAGGMIDRRFQMLCDSVGSPWGEQRLVYTNESSQRHGSRPVIFGNQIVALRAGELVAFDALTGAELWVRRGIPTDSDLFGDDEFVYVVTAEYLSARAFDAVTGEELPGVPVPPRSDRIAYLGRKIVSWKSDGANIQVSLMDPATRTNIWEQQFPRRVKVRMLEASNEFMTLDEDGLLQVVGLDDGKVRLKTRVPSIPESPLLTAFVDEDRYYVGISDSEAPKSDGLWQAPPQFTPIQKNDTAIIFGKLLAIDRGTGKLLWEQNVEGFGIAQDQPRGGPELVLVGVWGGQSQLLQRRRNIIGARSGVAVVDKRTGNILVKKIVDFPNLMDNLRIVKNPLAQEMQLDAQATPNGLMALKFKWSDEPAQVDPSLDLKLQASDNDRP